MIGVDVMNFCNDVLNGNRSVREVNETIIVLIPKISEPKDLTNYRPISLCRVIYKIIVKVWTNRLRCVLSRCICSN